MSDSTTSSAADEEFAPLASLKQLLTTSRRDHWLDALERLLRREHPWVGHAPTFPFGHRITVGGATADGLLDRLAQHGIAAGGYAKEMMSQAFGTEPAAAEEVTFLYAKVGEICGDDATTGEIFDEARLADVGLALCHPQDGVFLRLFHLDQPRGTCFWTAMEPLPLASTGGRLHVYAIGNDVDNRVFLHADCADPTDPGDRWRASDGFVFRAAESP